jgi:hypothetical protein
VTALAALSAALSLGLALTQPPYVGVACRQPNRTTCGRVGVAVWVGRPATAIEATVGGAHLVLHPSGGRRLPWTGFVRLDLRPMGIPAPWAGVKPIVIHLRVLRAGRWQTRKLRVLLHPGWG